MTPATSTTSSQYSSEIAASDEDFAPFNKEILTAIGMHGKRANNLVKEVNS